MFYPAHLNLQNRKCLVVGAGVVAERKVLSLLRSGGVVTLISPDATKTIENLSQAGQITWHKRQFHSGDTAGMFLVCAATDFPETNTQVFKEAHETHGINLVNVVDVIPECTFAAASVVTYGDVTISISTSGKSPAMSRRIREFLEAKFGVTSFYAESQESTATLPIGNQGLPYPVYFLLENRRCVVIRNEHEMDCGTTNMSPELTQHVDLLRRCGASIEYIDPTDVDAHRLADAFLVLITGKELACENISPPARNPGTISDQTQLIERLNAPKRGTFTTPLLVTDGDLIISISPNIESEADWDKAKCLQRGLACQFEKHGYGAFVDFLGSLRPIVMESISTQKGRQKFFDELIDHVPGTESHTCCLGFGNADCSIECAFNLVRGGQIEPARQDVLQRISKWESRYNEQMSS